MPKVIRPAEFDVELTEADGIILFDGFCAFCRNVVGQLLRQSDGAKLLVCSTRTPRGDRAARQMGGDPAYTFGLVTRSEAFLGVDAYVKILSLGTRSAGVGRLLAWTPRIVSGNVYQWVATHRPLMSRFFGRGSRDAIPPHRFVADPGAV